MTTREGEIRARLEAYDATLGESIDVQLDSWRPVNKSAVTDLRFMLGVVDKERKENERLRETLVLADSALESANAICARQQLEPLAPGYNIAPPEYERMMKPIWAYREARKDMQGDTK